jgi:hypothetical protein
MSFIKSKSTAVGIMFIIAFVIILDIFFTVDVLSNATDVVTSWTPLFINLSAIVGTASLLMRNGRAVMNKEKEWWMNAWVIILFIAVYMTYIVTGSTASVAYQWLYDNVYSNLQSATMGLLGFYILYSAARAFRARNLEVGILIFSAIIIFLTNATVGAAIWEGFPLIGNWLLNVPVFGSQRALAITGGIAAVLMGFRIIIGEEKTILG